VRVLLCTTASVLAGLLAGCHAAPAPSPGLATVVVDVSARPHERVKPRRESGSDPLYGGGYDSSPGSRSAYARVRYTALEDVVIWLAPQSADAAEKRADAVEIELRRSKSEPPLVAASCGATVRMRNASETPMVVYSVSEGNAFDLGSLAPGEVATWTARAPGLVEVLDESQELPIARVFVAPSCWVAVCRAPGRVALRDVVPGQYRLHAWHPRLPGAELPLTAEPDSLSSADIWLGVDRLPHLP